MTDPLPLRVAHWVRDALASSSPPLPYLPLPERITRLRNQWERSQFADVETSIDMLYKEIDRLKPSEQLREALYDLVGQLTIDNRFIIAEFPDFPDHSLTQSEITLLEKELRELAFTLDHEEKIRSAFLAQLKVLLDTLVQCYPEGTGNFSVPLHALIDTPALVQRLFYLFLEQFAPLHDRSTSLAFAATANTLYANYEAAKQIKPIESKLSPDECITTYLAGTPFVKFLNLPVPIAITRDQWVNHAIIAAPSGHGKTQTLGAIVHGFLEEDPPAIIIIEPHNDLINKIQHLSVFNPENGRLKDRLVVIDPIDKPGFNPSTKPPALLERLTAVQH